jgi:hypothetical protein
MNIQIFAMLLYSLMYHWCMTLPEKAFGITPDYVSSTHIFTFKIFENRNQKIYCYNYASVLYTESFNWQVFQVSHTRYIWPEL